MAPESMKQAEFSFKKHMEGMEVPPLEYTLIKKDGKLINTLISTKLIDYKEEKAILGIVTDITDQKRIERQIAASLNEKEVLLREIHHRVKNNMQIIISLMGMHSSRTKDTQVRQTLDECKDRIIAMSLVHEALYQTEDLARIDFEIYLKKLCSNLNQSHGASGKGIVITVEKCNVTLNMDQSIAVGIVSSELIANALKHAFPLGKGGRVSISLFSHNVEEVKLIIKDDGIGLPRKINILTASSLGLLLAVATVTRQLGGSIKVERNGGTRFIILFKKNAL
jgi:two-component sensor histidine kinase